MILASQLQAWTEMFPPENYYYIWKMKLNNIILLFGPWGLGRTGTSVCPRVEPQDK
jgi:hypothetical protein